MLHDGTDSPTVSVELDLGQIGTFVLGVSTLGGSDLLTAAVTSNWTALPSTAVRSVSIRRGRTREDQAMQPGTATIVLDNRSGNYDPDNISGPYVWGGYSMLTRGFPIRVRATYSATPYTLFTGEIENVIPDQSLDPTATITAVDGLSTIAGVKVATIASSFSGDTTATRAGRILDAASWPASARSLTGTRQMQPTTYNATALALFEQCAACEGGRVYADRSGNLVLLPYESTFTTTQRLTLSDTRAAGTLEYDVIQTSPGGAYMVNQVNLTYTSGSTVTVTSPASQARFGTFSRDVTAPLLNLSEATAVAQSIADRFALPATRVDRIEYDGPGAGSLWPSILQADLAERVSVIRNTVDGRSRTYGCVIESISHDITVANWRIGYDLSPAASSVYFTLGTSTLGGTDALYY